MLLVCSQVVVLHSFSLCQFSQAQLVHYLLEQVELLRSLGLFALLFQVSISFGRVANVEPQIPISLCDRVDVLFTHLHISLMVFLLPKQVLIVNLPQYLFLELLVPLEVKPLPY